MKALIDDRDQRIVTAALEAPDVLSGLTAETRVQVEEAYMRANRSTALKALDDLEEALSLLDAAARIAITEVQSNDEMGQMQFDEWFATAGGSETARAA